MVERLVLWDIDGTLVRTSGVGSRVFDEAFTTVLGYTPEATISMGGKTDPQIVHEYLTLLHEDPAHLPTVLRHIEEGLAAAASEVAAHGCALPGVEGVLARLAADDRVASSVLTGNIAPNATVKLAAFGLDRWLDLEIGAYGSDHMDRNELVPVAIGRLAELRGMAVQPDQVWIVGDTPRDAACAAIGGAHCVLVGTGMFPVSELEQLDADAVLPDLSDTEAVLRLLLDGLELAA